MVTFRVLPGLPGSGDWPVQFSSTGSGTHREGLVVEFSPENGADWVGNFQPGLTSYSTVLPVPKSTFVIVLAGGTAYVIDPENRRLVEAFGGQLDAVLPAPDVDLLLFASLTDVQAWGANGRAWRTRRLAGDGMSNLHVAGTTLNGLAYDPGQDRHLEFSVDLTTGETTGGVRYP